MTKKFQVDLIWSYFRFFEFCFNIPNNEFIQVNSSLCSTLLQIGTDMLAPFPKKFSTVLFSLYLSTPITLSGTSIKICYIFFLFVLLVIEPHSLVLRSHSWGELVSFLVGLRWPDVVLQITSGSVVCKENALITVIALQPYYILYILIMNVFLLLKMYCGSLTDFQ